MRRLATVLALTSLLAVGAIATAGSAAAAPGGGAVTSGGRIDSHECSGGPGFATCFDTVGETRTVVTPSGVAVTQTNVVDCITTYDATTSAVTYRTCWRSHEQSRST